MGGIASRLRPKPAIWVTVMQCCGQWAHLMHIDKGEILDWVRDVLNMQVPRTIGLQTLIIIARTGTACYKYLRSQLVKDRARSQATAIPIWLPGILV